MLLFSVGVIEQNLQLVPKIQVFLAFSTPFLSRFAILLELLLQPLGLRGELNSASNSNDFRHKPIIKVNTDGPKHAKYYYVNHKSPFLHSDPFEISNISSSIEFCT
jgi:hypothetical protein